MDSKTYIVVQTFNRDVLHKTAPLLSDVLSIKTYDTNSGKQYHIETSEGLILIMPKSVYGYMINGEHVALPDPSTLVSEGPVPEALKDLARVTQTVTRNTPAYIDFEKDN